MSSFARGERVYFDFESGGITAKVDAGTSPAPRQQGDEIPAPVGTAFVGEILERPAAAITPPSAPALKDNVNGFPRHGKRAPRESAFKKRRAVQARTADVTAFSATAPGEQNVVRPPRLAQPTKKQDERRQIDEENRQRLAGMSEREIEQEKNELLQSLSPSLIQKLLGRADIGEGSNERDLGLGRDPSLSNGLKNEDDQVGKTVDKKVASADLPDKDGRAARQQEPNPQGTEAPSTILPPGPRHDRTDPEIEAAKHLLPDTGALHFPDPPQPPDLDPDDPDFLKNMHDKYFPSLPYDPSSLSWMAPIDPSDKSSPYHPSQTAFNASDLRFDFKGALLAPSAARSIPVTKGLHHHAEAPEAAGYTIPELAAMARSTVPAQRCMAFQTLGRFLYRLGRGEFGFEKVRQRSGLAEGPVKVARDPGQTPAAEEEEVDEDDVEVDTEDAASAMAAGLWHCVEEGRVVETLTEEAGRERGHLTSRTFAQEALWNWRRGGGRRRQAI